MQQRLTIQSDQVQLLCGDLVQENRQNAIPGANDGAEDKAVPLTSAGQDPACDQGNELNSLEQQQVANVRPQFVRVASHHGEQHTCKKVLQGIEQTLSQDQANEDSSPGRLLPARTTTWRR
jgi:hypothetical protein